MGQVIPNHLYVRLSQFWDLSVRIVAQGRIGYSRLVGTQRNHPEGHPRCCRPRRLVPRPDSQLDRMTESHPPQGFY